MTSPRRHTLLKLACLSALLAGILLFAARQSPAFVALTAQLELAPHAAELAIIALPLTFIIMSGGIDLSVGSTMALAAVVLGLLFERGTPVALASAAALCVGGAAGALNGLIITRTRVHSLIVTLGTMAMVRGLAEGLSKGRAVSAFPEWFLALADQRLLGLPLPVMAMTLCAIAFFLFAACTVQGRWIPAVGDNDIAARSCGVPSDALTIFLFTLSGLAAALCGVVFTIRRATAKADIGSGIELEAITAVLLGGTSIRGGRGSILGTMLGVAIIHEMREFISWQWQKDEIIPVVLGAILILAVLIQRPDADARST